MGRLTCSRTELLRETDAGKVQSLNGFSLVSVVSTLVGLSANPFYSAEAENDRVTQQQKDMATLLLSDWADSKSVAVL